MSQIYSMYTDDDTDADADDDDDDDDSHIKSSYSHLTCLSQLFILISVQSNDLVKPFSNTCSSSVIALKSQDCLISEAGKR